MRASLWTRTTCLKASHCSPSSRRPLERRGGALPVAPLLHDLACLSQPVAEEEGQAKSVEQWGHSSGTLNHPVALPLRSCSRSLPQTGKDCPGWHECTPAL